MDKKIISRPKYLEQVKPYMDKNIIKVFTGQRRVGKSFILKMTIEHIQTSNPRANIIYIDKELYEFDFISDYHTLITHVENNLHTAEKNYLFIDEIQEIKGFEKALRHFQNRQNVDVYCTGSNAEMLSGDLAGLLSGRFIQIQVSVLSYPEFLEFHQLKVNHASLEKYLKWGGLPFIKNLQKEDEIIFDYLTNIISTIIYKDVLYRYKIRNVDFFDNLIRFVASNTGNLITAKKISDYLKSQKTDISTRVVINYLDYLQNAFLIYKIKRLDIQSKKIFEINNKYFFEDWGLRNALLGLSHFSVPDVLENVVYSHLKQLGYSVSIGLLKNLEIDFVAEKKEQRVYIQVAYLITDHKVKEREFGNLLTIKDNYPKIVVSLDPYTIGDYKGVKHLHLQDFLLQNSFQ
jgi:hypothetical protein